ncbi:small glutamine-rich tetratricopeptide repeat-containing protein 2 [Humulus lupulus]|uniref:small glutamine-rich tetratricopeptide repeat-containing protein 2 n=1 Tax=Humulus lupulus TaxID=3486 RepID=UPI002B40EDBF|nr:small glutamine-rich tetratricopeptide repeat-containing protein 2 [Humulus lupulus]
MEVLLPNRTLSFSKPTATCFPKRRRLHRRCCFISQLEEIRVCTNRTCRRQGSLLTLETLTGIAPPTVTVKSCGCLSRCGAGPNLVALPSAVVVSHCGTAARSAEVLAALCGASWDADAAKKSLEALALRKKAEIEFDKGNFSQAELLLSQAIELKPMGGMNIIYKDRSRTRLAMDKYHEALADAKEALVFTPQYVEAYICQGDAFLAMNRFDTAEKSYLTALEIDPSIRRSKSFKARIANLQEKVASVNMP